MIKYITVDSDGKIVMTKEEFGEYLVDAWNDGYHAGLNVQPLTHPNNRWWKDVKYDSTGEPNSDGLLMRYIKNGHELPPVGIDEDEYLKGFYNERKD